MSAAAKSQSERIASILRDEDARLAGPGAREGDSRTEAAGLDALRRARLERQFLDAARKRGEDGVPTARAAEPATRSARRRAMVVGSFVAVTAAAALAMLSLRSEPSPTYAVRSVGAAPSGLVTGGPIVAGTELALAGGESATLTLFDLTTEVSERSRFRVEALSRDDVRVELATGEARFAFHPEERGRQHVAIRTPAARIEIVGTELTVRVGEGGTEVTVHEGVVRVIPEVGDVALVHAGSSLAVPRAVTASTPEAATEAGPTEAQPTEAALGAGADEPHEEIPGMGDTGTTAAGEGGTPSPAADVDVPMEDAADEEAPSDAARLHRAEELLDRHERAAAERLLADVAATALSRADRASAWRLLAESRETARDYDGALNAYEREYALARGEARANSVYERALILEARLHDEVRARAEWLRYLTEFPDGPNASGARVRLCALGGAEGVDCASR